MKKVYILRHALWKYPEGILTPEGKEQINIMQQTINEFSLVISSPSPRAQETAKLLTGKEAVIDQRANILDVTEEELDYIITQGNQHPFGMAGVIFEDAKFIQLARNKGKELVNLILETLQKLTDNQTALIISHDGPIVAAEKLLQNEPFDEIRYSYKPLEGFTVDEKLHIQRQIHSHSLN